MKPLMLLLLSGISACAGITPSLSPITLEKADTILLVPANQVKVLLPDTGHPGVWMGGPTTWEIQKPVVLKGSAAETVRFQSKFDDQSPATNCLIFLKKTGK